MADIGEALREARMRRRIDMSEVESATKIRAKYLRALENEEWQMLPGPTFVKTFLRTYAEYLGLDARTLVEEYKLRFERPSSGDLTPFAPVAARGTGRLRRRRSIGRWLILPFIVVLVAGGLWLLGRQGDDSSDAGEGSPPGEERSAPAQASPVTLSIVATRAVRVCLIDARDRERVPGRRLRAGRRTQAFTSRSFEVGFDGGPARMRVGDRSFRVPARSEPIGYVIRAGEDPERLPARRVPDCR
jgi:cytoskeleton protein RodZ